MEKNWWEEKYGAIDEKLIEGLPESYFDPISLELMEDPVSLITGHTFNKKSIQKAFEKKENINPLTNLKLENSILIPNRALHDAIFEWLESNKVEAEKAVEQEAVQVKQKKAPPIKQQEPKEYSDAEFHQAANGVKYNLEFMEYSRCTKNQVIAALKKNAKNMAFVKKDKKLSKYFSKSELNALVKKPVQKIVKQPRNNFSYANKKVFGESDNNNKLKKEDNGDGSPKESNEKKEKPSKYVKDYDQFCKLLIIGDTGVGKSCLLLRFCDDTYTESYISTIGCDYKVKNIKVNNQRVKIQAWDLAGQRRYSRIHNSHYWGANAIILCFDLTDRDSFDNLKQWLNELEKFRNKGIPVILVGTKGDLVSQHIIGYNEAFDFVKKTDVISHYYVTSAKYGMKCGQPFEKAAELSVAPKEVVNTDAAINNSGKNTGVFSKFAAFFRRRDAARQSEGANDNNNNNEPIRKKS